MAHRRAHLLLVLSAFLMGLPLRAQEKSLDELLALDMTDLLRLKVVSALKRPETINKVPATVRVITADEIRDNGYFTLEDALSDLPGVPVPQHPGVQQLCLHEGRSGPEQQGPRPGGRDPGQRAEFRGVLRRQGSTTWPTWTGSRSSTAPRPPFTAPTPSPASSASSPGIPRTRREAGPRSWPGASTRAWRIFRYAAYDKKADLGFSVAAMYKQSDKADLRGKAGDFNWTEEWRTSRTTPAFDARVRVQGFQRGLHAAGQGYFLRDRAVGDRGRGPGLR